MRRVMILFAITFIVSLILLLLVGCGNLHNEKGDIIRPTVHLDSNVVIVVEGCEYFVVSAYSSVIYVHKGNCKNPIHPENWRR